MRERPLPLFEMGLDRQTRPELAEEFRRQNEVDHQADSNLNIDIASEFLLKTLVPRPALREIGGVTFVTAYVWRAAVKDLQIKSLRILKRHLPDPFVEHAGLDLVNAIRKLHGETAFGLVVPVPCGHSQRDDCLSYRLAASVARNLDTNFAAALGSVMRTGSSHPKQSQHFKKPRVICRVGGKVLVVDDVCTTGRHMALSVRALREAGADAFGIAWIGSK